MQSSLCADCVQIAHTPPLGGERITSCDPLEMAQNIGDFAIFGRADHDRGSNGGANCYISFGTAADLVFAQAFSSWQSIRIGMKYVDELPSNLSEYLAVVVVDVFRTDVVP